MGTERAPANAPRESTEGGTAEVKDFWTEINPPYLCGRYAVKGMEGFS